MHMFVRIFSKTICIQGLGQVSVVRCQAQACATRQLHHMHLNGAQAHQAPPQLTYKNILGH